MNGRQEKASGIEIKDKSIGNIILGQVVTRDPLFVTYKGTNKQSSKPVLISVLDNSYHNDADIVRNFLSSSLDISSRIVNKKHLAAIIEAKKISNEIFIILEGIDGVPLGSWLEKQEELPSDEKIRLARQLCESFRQLHQKRVVHAGLCMESIIVTPGREIKIIDYCTTYQHMMGKVCSSLPIKRLCCTAPELFGEKELNFSSGTFNPAPDIFSIGMILEEIRTGSPVVKANTYESIREAICNSNFTTVHHQVRKAVDKDPGKRCKNVGEIMHMLEDIFTSENRQANEAKPPEPKPRPDSSSGQESPSNSGNTGEPDIDTVIQTHLELYCKDRYLGVERFESILKIIQPKLPGIPVDEINIKIQARAKQLRIFDETKKIKELIKNIDICVKNRKISKKKFKQIIGDAVNMGMRKNRAEIEANAYLEKKGYQITLF
jgi:serine/threonine protein kinase